MRKVGPGRPPKSTRFRKGVSGNPAGRPRKERRADPASAFAVVIDRTLTITQDRKSREVTRRGSESRSLALVPATRKAPALFSPWRAKISRGLRACYVISTLVGLRQDRRWGLSVLRF